MLRYTANNIVNNSITGPTPRTARTPVLWCTGTGKLTGYMDWCLLAHSHIDGTVCFSFNITATVLEDYYDSH